MAIVPGINIAVELPVGERVSAAVAADGYFASQHANAAPEPYVVITNQRLIVYTQRGVMKKRLEEVASWPLRRFTERINTSEGSALGSFMHVLTLFVDDGETVSTGFKTAQRCEEFKQTVVTALGPLLG